MKKTSYDTVPQSHHGTPEAEEKKDTARPTVLRTVHHFMKQ